MGNQTSQNLDTPEGVEGRLSIGIRRIPAELQHSTKLELRKTSSNLNGFRQSFHTRVTPRTPDKPGSAPALRTSPLSLLYKERTWEHYR
jgi:hypothetical protein